MIEQTNVFNLKANSLKQVDLGTNLDFKNKQAKGTSKFEQVFSKEVAKDETLTADRGELAQLDKAKAPVKGEVKKELRPGQEVDEADLEELDIEVLDDKLSILLGLLNQITAKLEEPQSKLDLENLELELESLLETIDLGSLDQEVKNQISSQVTRLEESLASINGKNFSLEGLKLEEMGDLEKSQLEPIIEKISLALEEASQFDLGPEKDLAIEETSQDLSMELGPKFKEVAREVKTDIKLDDENLEIRVDLEEVEALDLDTEEDSSQMDLSKFDNPSKLLTRPSGDDLVKLDQELSFSPNFEVPEEDIVKQLVSKMDFKLAEGKNEVSIQLKPEILGNLKMDIELEKGSITAKILVDNYRTKEVLETNIASLQTKLEENGLEIKTVEVSVGNNADFEKQDGEKQFDNFKKQTKRLKAKKDKIAISKNYESNLKVETYDSKEINLEEGMNLFA